MLSLSRKLRKGQRAANRIAKTLLKALPSAPKAKPRVKKAAPRKTPSTVRGAPMTFVEGRFNGADGTLDYKLYTPSGSSRRKLPLVVMLHGCGQTAADFASGTGMNARAKKPACWFSIRNNPPSPISADAGTGIGRLTSNGGGESRRKLPR
jgi:predicted dienelactone hydrolase